MNPFEMVVVIVGIVMLASVIKSRHRGRDADLAPQAGPPVDADSARLRDEIRQLKERIAVLERLATDTNGAVALDREIEKLRQG